MIQRPRRRRFLDSAQDACNELHVYCRLRGFGLPKGISCFLASLWGAFFTPVIYARSRRTPWIGKR